MTCRGAIDEGAGGVIRPDAEVFHRDDTACLIHADAAALPLHFAAFPQEWPRRIILGWSPSGICVECGEGRRPVVAKEFEALRPPQDGRRKWGMDSADSGEGTTVVPGQNVATITGYACACPTPDAPTRPAVVLDPFGGTGTTAMVARALGRYGVHVDLSHDYLRLAKWRVWESGHASKSRERANREAQGVLL